jgi:hypothetical protein
MFLLQCGSKKCDERKIRSYSNSAHKNSKIYSTRGPLGKTWGPPAEKHCGTAMNFQVSFLDQLGEYLASQG